MCRQQVCSPACLAQCSVAIQQEGGPAGLSRATNLGLADKVTAQLPNVLEHSHVVTPAVRPKLAGRELLLQDTSGPWQGTEEGESG